jgi:hypothetical protein
MLKTLILLLLIPVIGFSQPGKVLTQDYIFLTTNGPIIKLHQRNDTLYELKCFIDGRCLPRQSKHYKIISSDKKGDFIMLKVERLDTIHMTTDPYPLTRYAVLALKGIGSRQLGYLPIETGLIEKQLDTIETNVQLLDGKFFFTFFSQTYIKELSILKKVTTKEEANEILEAAKSDKFKPLADRYAKTKTGDLYNSGFIAELLNRACIEKGYSPIGAAMSINLLLK